MKRIIDHYLQEWKQQDDHKSLLIRGARQVGKTYSIRNLGQSFEELVEINFEKNPNTRIYSNRILTLKGYSGIFVWLQANVLSPGRLFFSLTKYSSIRQLSPHCDIFMKRYLTYMLLQQGHFWNLPWKVLASQLAALHLYICIRCHFWSTLWHVNGMTWPIIC